MLLCRTLQLKKKLWLVTFHFSSLVFDTFNGMASLNARGWQHTSVSYSILQNATNPKLLKDSQI